VSPRLIAQKGRAVQVGSSLILVHQADINQRIKMQPNWEMQFQSMFMMAFVATPEGLEPPTLSSED
jgi:hypothetical protein